MEVVLSLLEQFWVFVNDGDEQSLDVLVQSGIMLLCVTQCLHHL